MVRLQDHAYHVPDALSLTTKGSDRLKGPLKPCQSACDTIQIWDFYRPSTWREKKKTLRFSLLWKCPFLQHQQERDVGWAWVQDSPSVVLVNIALFLCFFTELCLCESSLRQRSSFFFWYSIWHSRIWINNQFLCASIKHFWHEHYLRTNQTFKTAHCSCASFLCTGELHPLRSHYGAGFHTLKMLQRQWFREFSCPTSHPPNHLVLSVQLFLRPMLRTRIGNWSGFMKKKMAKEWNCIFTDGPLSKVSEPCTTKGLHCSKWMGTSNSTGLSVGINIAPNCLICWNTAWKWCSEVLSSFHFLFHPIQVIKLPTRLLRASHLCS